MKDRIASRALLFGILVLFAMLTVPSVSAHDADAIYFLPEDISVSGCGTTETVAIWINASVALGGGVAEFSYDSSCANVTAYDPNTDWNLVNDAGFTTGNLKIGFSRNGALGPGLVKIGDITINCTDCASSCCGTKLVWNTTSSYIQDSGGAGVSANWVDGTFVCGEPLVVEKTVWDGSAWVDSLGPLTSDWMGKDVRFNITLTAGCLDISNVMVFDVMDAGLQYNNSATPGEDASTAHTADWTTLGTLAAGTSTSFIVIPSQRPSQSAAHESLIGYSPEPWIIFMNICRPSFIVMPEIPSRSPHVPPAPPSIMETLQSSVSPHSNGYGYPALAMVPFHPGVIWWRVSVIRIHVGPGVAPTVENDVDVNVPSATPVNGIGWFRTTCSD